MPTDPLIPPAVGIVDNPVHRICINAEWWSHVSGQISRLIYPEMWDGTDAEVYAAIQTIVKFLNVGQPVTDCEDTVIYPTRAELHHEAAKLTAGNAFAWLAITGQADAGSWFQSAAAINDEFFHSVYLAAGTYGMFILGNTRPNNGIATWKFDGVTFAASDDWYSLAVGLNVIHYYPITCLTDGTHELRCKIAAKNAASGGYIFPMNRYWIRLN